jgi:hypothetical protein
MGVEKGSMRLTAAVAAVAGATGLAAVSGVGATGRTGGGPAPAAFRLADHAVGCAVVAPDRLVCRAAGAEAGTALDASGASTATGEPVAWDASTPVLLPAESWWNGPFACRVRGDAVSCSAGGGAISVSTGGAGGVR